MSYSTVGSHGVPPAAHLRLLIERGRPTVGGWCLIPSAHTAEVVARSGFDWVVIDTQHGLIGYETMTSMLRAVDTARTPSLVRVSSNNASEIGKALDAGAHGVIIPLVNTADQARAAVRACRYPPDGVRSFGPVRAGWTIEDYGPDSANRATVCLVQVETVDAVAEIESIVAVPGLDGVYLGPWDLALSAGAKLTAEVEHMEHLHLIDRVSGVVRDRGLALGTVCRDGAAVLDWAARGFTMLSCGTDDSFLRERCSGEASLVKRARSWA